MSAAQGIAGLKEFFERAAERARQARVFGPIFVHGNVLNCEAHNSAAEAYYRLTFDAGKLWVSLVTKDRWLSQSIEADLVHTGDKLEDLLGEELADQGYAGPAPDFEHFRSEEKDFTFRSLVPVDASKLADPAAADTAATFILAYEACFRRLGDMDAAEE
jgi:hypothetical protein